MDKKSLSERDICTKLIVPALQSAGWDIQAQVREEVTFTKGRVIVRGKLHTRGKARRADFVLYHSANRPIAVIEAKDNTHGPGEGMQQVLDYAESLDVPFAFTSNGDGFVFHDRSGGGTGDMETVLTLNRLLKKRGVRGETVADEGKSGSHVADGVPTWRNQRSVCAACGAPRASAHPCGADPRRHVATPTCMSVRIRTRLYTAVVKRNSQPTFG